MGSSDQTAAALTAQTVRHIAEATAKTALGICNGYNFLASLGVVHPVQNDLGSPVPTGHHVARHLSISTAGQAEVQNLEQKQRDHNTTETPVYYLFITKIMS